MRFLLALLVCIIISGGIIKKTIFESAPAAVTAQKLLDEEFTNVNLMRFDKEGNLMQTVHVEKWLHYREEPKVNLIGPTLTLNRQTQSWTIHSQEGIAFQTKVGGPLAKVILENDVQIHYQNNQNTGWELFTDILSLYPDQQIAKTDSWVNIIGPNYTLRAHGMDANLAHEDIEFKQSVKGEFQYEG